MITLGSERLRPSIPDKGEVPTRPPAPRTARPPNTDRFPLCASPGAPKPPGDPSGDPCRGPGPYRRPAQRSPAGSFEYDFGDTAETTPLIEMLCWAAPSSRLRSTPGACGIRGRRAPFCRPVKDGVVEAVAYHQTNVFHAAVQSARAKGIIPASEAAHAVLAAIDGALACKDTGEDGAILFGLSGHGLLDLKGIPGLPGGRPAGRVGGVRWRRRSGRPLSATGGSSWR